MQNIGSYCFFFAASEYLTNKTVYVLSLQITLKIHKNKRIVTVDPNL